MEISTKYCQKELEEYGSCVASNPSSWQQKCQDLKLKVAQCTSSQYVYFHIFKSVLQNTFNVKNKWVCILIPPLFLASQCSPVIRKIQADCADQFSLFERCLRENQSSAETCQPHIARFLACAETVDISELGEQWSQRGSWITSKMRPKNIWIYKHDSLNSNKVIWIYDCECEHESKDL